LTISEFFFKIKEEKMQIEAFISMDTLVGISLSKMAEMMILHFKNKED